MQDFEKIYTGQGNTLIVLNNRYSDPSMWIVNVYKKILFFKKKIISYWFYSKKEAEIFAENYIKSDKK